MCALPVEARQELAPITPLEDQEGDRQVKKAELRLVRPPSEEVKSPESQMEKLPIRLVVDQKFERMEQIMARWQHEPAPAQPADLGGKGMSFDLIAFVNLHDAVKHHPDLLNAEQQARYQEIVVEARKRFDGKVLARIGIKDL